MPSNTVSGAARMQERIHSLEVQIDVQERLTKRYRDRSTRLEEKLRAVMEGAGIHKNFIEETVSDCY